MLSDAQMRALRATARLAFALSGVAACGGTTTTPGNTPNDGATSTNDSATSEAAAGDDAAGDDASTAHDSASEASTRSDASLSCDLSQPESNAAFECCIAHEASVFAADAGGADPTTMPCCKAIVDRIDGDTGDASAQLVMDYQQAEPALNGCCRLLGTPIGPACTPWGPPPPPAMPEEVA
jgi:hypothetical protein